MNDEAKTQKKKRGPSKFWLIRQIRVDDLIKAAAADPAMNALPVLIVDASAGTLRGLDGQEREDGLHHTVCVRETFNIKTEQVRTRKTIRINSK